MKESERDIDVEGAQDNKRQANCIPSNRLAISCLAVFNCAKIGERKIKEIKKSLKTV